MEFNHYVSNAMFFHCFCYRITEYEASERLSRDIQAQIVYRNSQAKLSAEYGKLSATIRIRLKQLTAELEQLDRKLEQNSVTGKMYVPPRMLHRTPQKSNFFM